MEGYNATLDRAREKRKRRKQKKIQRILLIAAAVLLLAVLIFMIGRILGSGSGDPTPQGGALAGTETGETGGEEASSEETGVSGEETGGSQTGAVLPEQSSGETRGASETEQGETSLLPGEGPDMTDTEQLMDDFSDAVFIGASQTANLQKMTEMEHAAIYGKVGLNIDTVFTKEFIPLKNGSKGTVMDALGENQFRRVYILLGVNELGWPYMSVFKERYGKIVDEIKRLQPDADIYVQSILPITKEKSDGDSIYNQANVEKFNQGIQEMCKEHGVYYLDVAAALKNSAGYLPPGVSKDGVHLNHAYSIKWMNTLSKLTKQAGGR